MNEDKTTCRNCKFGEFLPLQDVKLPGACKKNPPVPLLLVTTLPMGTRQVAIQPVFPPVFVGDWCGAAEPKFNQ